MTTVIVEKDMSGNYKGFTCMGHANFAKVKRGKSEPDILCAAISALTANTVNGMEELAGEKLAVTQNQKDGFLKVIFEEPIKESSVLLLESMILSLREISKEYGEKYLTLQIKEVKENAET